MTDQDLDVTGYLDELSEIDPTHLCVLRTSSAAEAKRAADTLVDRTYSVQVDAERVDPSVTTGMRNRQSYTLWVDPRQAQAAAGVLAEHGFSSEVEPALAQTVAKPWVSSYRRWLGRAVLVLVIIWFVWLAKFLLSL